MPEQMMNFSVDASLLHAFSHIASKNSCSDEELLKAFMEDYVQQDIRKQQYEAWFRSKVERGLAELREGKGCSHKEAFAQMSVFKTSLLKTSEEHAL